MGTKSSALSKPKLQEDEHEEKMSILERIEEKLGSLSPHIEVKLPPRDAPIIPPANVRVDGDVINVHPSEVVVTQPKKILIHFTRDNNDRIKSPVRLEIFDE